MQCLQSLQKQTFTDFEIILLDDASPNDSVAQLGAHLPANTVFLPQSQNLGFAAANNVGIRRALADGCDWVLLLNNDTVAAPDFLQNLLANTPAGAVSCPKMLFMDPPDEIWFAGGALDRATARSSTWAATKRTGRRSRSQSRSVSSPSAACCCRAPSSSASVFWTKRCSCTARTSTTACAWATPACRCGFLPQARIWHKAGGSAGGMLSVYYITRNTLYLTCKGKSKAYARVKTVGPLAAGAARYALTKLLGRKKGRSYGAWRGALDFWRGKMGRME